MLKIIVLFCITFVTLIPPSEGQEIQELIRRYQADQQSLERFYNIPYSETYRERIRTFQRSWLERLESLDDPNRLLTEQIDLFLLKNHIEHELRLLDRQIERWSEIAPILPFAKEIIEFEESRWKLVPIVPMETAKRLAQMSKEVTDLQKSVKKKASPADVESSTEEAPVVYLRPVHALRAAKAMDHLADVLDRWHRHYSEYHPEFNWWCKQPYAEASNALQDYKKYLREEIAGQKGKEDDPLVGDPIGREALQGELHHELIPYTPEELIEMGEKELMRCKEWMRECAEAVGCASDWKQALAIIQEDHVPPGEQDLAVSDYAKKAIDYVENNRLVTVPALCKETWRVEMLSEAAQKTLPFAAYGGQHMLVAYPTHTMGNERKIDSMQGNNVHYTKIVTAHELIPGHHLQGFIAQRERPYRQMFTTPFYVEGWALHWEMLLWDKGYAEDAKDKLGMLFWRAHRCARILVSLQFHLGQRTPQEMIDFLVTEVGLEKDGAASEVRRYIGEDYGPLYQCAYMIGGLQLRALYREQVQSGKRTDKDFHDAVLSQNAIPIALIRAALRDDGWDRDHVSRWRFDRE